MPSIHFLPLRNLNEWPKEKNEWVLEELIIIIFCGCYFQRDLRRLTPPPLNLTYKVYRRMAGVIWSLLREIWLEWSSFATYKTWLWVAMSNCTKNVVLATNQNNGSFGGEGVFDCFYHSPPTYLQWVKATLLRKHWWPKCHLVHWPYNWHSTQFQVSRLNFQWMGNKNIPMLSQTIFRKEKCPILHLSVALQQQAAAAGVGFCQHTQIAYVFASDVRQGDRGKQGKSKKESLPMSASFPYGIFCHVTESQP